MRTAGLVAAGVAIAAVALVLLVGGLRSRDAGGVGAGRQAPAPGRAVPAATGATGALLRAGNVILVARDPRDLSATRAAARLLGGAPTAALTAAGQAVLARGDAGAPAPYLALAYERELTLSRLADPRLRAFVDHWLGRGARR